MNYVNDICYVWRRFNTLTNSNASFFVLLYSGRSGSGRKWHDACVACVNRALNKQIQFGKESEEEGQLLMCGHSEYVIHQGTHGKV